MTDAQYEITYLNETLTLLKEYLLQDALFYPVHLSGKPSYPKLTLGNVLFSLARLRAVDATGAEKLRAQVDVVKTQWLTHWEKKLQQEYTSRQRQWQTYLEDLAADFRKHSPYYDTAVRPRALLALISAELGEGKLPDDAALLPTLDTMMWTHLIEGPIMWDQDLQSVFPQEDYWFIYGYLHG